MNKKSQRVFLFVLALVAVIIPISGKFFVNKQTQNIGTVLGTVQGQSRGYITSQSELVALKQKSDSGTEPYRTNVTNFLNYIGTPETWNYGTASGEFKTISINGSNECVSETQIMGDKVLGDEAGSPLIYGKALAYHLSGNAQYAAKVREILLDLTDTYGFDSNVYSGSNQCILHLAFGIPNIIQAADLLETYPGWTASDKVQFQTWLMKEVYPKVAWASRARKNNWGSAGSLSSTMIADYVHNTSNFLNEYSPNQLSLTPADAYSQHKKLQLDRMNTEWKGDSNCTKWGIQPYGGIPDETRRGTTGCDGQFILALDSSWSYQITQIDFLIYNAEFLLRRGDNSIYDNIAANGSGSLLNSIKFVIDNPLKIVEWKDSKKSSLFAAYRYYKQPSIGLSAKSLTSTKGGSIFPFGRLTHEFAENETISLPPTVTPPIVIKDISLPVITFVNLTDSMQIKRSSKDTNITVKASDPSSISSIKILMNGLFVKECLNTTQCTYAWKTRSLSTGTYTFRVIAVDNSTEKNMSESSIRIVLK